MSALTEKFISLERGQLGMMKMSGTVVLLFLAAVLRSVQLEYDMLFGLEYLNRSTRMITCPSKSDILSSHLVDFLFKDATGDVIRGDQRLRPREESQKDATPHQLMGGEILLPPCACFLRQRIVVLSLILIVEQTTPEMG